MPENEGVESEENAESKSESKSSKGPKFQCMRCVGRNKITLLTKDQIDAHRKKEHKGYSVYMKEIIEDKDIKKPE